MRILLLGRTGQVGWELERAMAPLGQVIALGRGDLDLADPGRIPQAVSSTEPDLIVNAAAYTAVDRAESEPEIAHAVNAIAPGHLASAARRHGAAIIHLSTDYVFSGASEDPYAEDDPTNPLSVYGHSKLQGEQAVCASGVPYLVLRTSWVYGNRGQNFLNTMFRLFRERSVVRVVNDQIGAPTWSRKIAEAIATVVAHLVGRSGEISTAMMEKSGIYHLTAAGRTTWHGFASAIMERLVEIDPEGIRARTVEAIASDDYPSAAQRPRNSLLSNEKIQRVFGLGLPTWEEQLDACLAERLDGS